ncbi:RNA polymerase sigma-70 factor (ECF subfamily) [Tenggerimyces flavus]|nr:RNA polymerase sigma-70 factor (ECF subfamily) [Tenggerimyces flavus]
MHTAEDVVAETFAIAWRRIDRVPSHALPWLLVTARKVLANELRGEARRSALVERIAALDADSAQSLPAAIEGKHDVLAAVSQLSTLDQEILTVSAWYDLSAREAARVVGCSPATYAVRLFRARRRLRTQLSRAGSSLALRTKNDQEVQP